MECEVGVGVEMKGANDEGKSTIQKDGRSRSRREEMEKNPIDEAGK